MAQTGSQNIYKQMMTTAVNAGLAVMPKNKAAKLLAACYVYGDEPFVLAGKLHTDTMLAAQVLGIEPGATIPPPRRTLHRAGNRPSDGGGTFPRPFRKCPNVWTFAALAHCPHFKCGLWRRDSRHGKSDSADGFQAAAGQIRERARICQRGSLAAESGAASSSSRTRSLPSRSSSAAA